MRFNLSFQLTDKNGTAQSSGYVNVYKTHDGRIVTMSKVYPDASTAKRWSRAPGGATHAGVLNLAEYPCQDCVNAAKTAAIHFADRWLGNKFGAGIAPSPVAAPAEEIGQLPEPVVAKKAVKKVAKKILEIAEKVNKKIAKKKKGKK